MSEPVLVHDFPEDRHVHVMEETLDLDLPRGGYWKGRSCYCGRRGYANLLLPCEDHYDVAEHRRALELFDARRAAASIEESA